ncbi:hypothetical protein [Lysinibacillus xylanilyticus]|uniref:Uncharacterized protein n=1 Tax=Lysinibacillus xylanilyticus TaxID=582475 RepID=A0ABT4EVA3_9BACI|nr:hypothetical protein [Lysinibacillus xylanilyticus]MCY9549602.1 hypothetical protein [Lysinibacillus xylanilyticus]
MKALELNALEICIILKEAKVNFVSQLIDKPVEITFENNLFKSFSVKLRALYKSCSFIIKIDQINANSLDKQAKRKSVF